MPEISAVTEEYLSRKVFDPVSFALTFDDLTLVPQYSEKGPKQVDVRTRLTKGGEKKKEIRLNIPVVSAAMDTVTEKDLAIALALVGGIGILHKNNTAEEQARMVTRVKRWMSAMIPDPIVARPEWRVAEVVEKMEKYKISGLPVVDEQHRLVGIITRRDVASFSGPERKVSSVMTSKVFSVLKGTDDQEAARIMSENRIEKLPVVEETESGKKLVGLYTAVDIRKRAENPMAALDERKRLLVGAAVGDVWEDYQAKVEALVKAGVDVLVVDTAHGHTANMREMLKRLNELYPHLPLIAGNITTPEAAIDLISWGADAIKIGQGPSSICTTRVIAGIGIPQMTAIMECAAVAGDVPVIADGGIKYSGDITKAIGAGASSVMLGTLLAGTAEAPGDIIYHNGKHFKVYRGMGSIGAMKEGSSDRYGQAGMEEKKLVAEGVEGRIAYRGKLVDHVFQLIGGLRAGMGYCGCAEISELKEKALFRIITGSGLRESHPHDIEITEQAPNYAG